ncbi:MAG: type 1 periplasmic binding fold superfamily protein [Saprospiraceae bacterium]|jgi:hypothetical protein|uniref:hypothetical protein n=1 Tax=Candidatus Brachybacter algidus TaxID=2982024 RepID=UPI001B6AB042|nr:hypothetical protein [Candidatus Brachybacter algidus]MBP7305364.1 hypothetical protein [Saprospiraceae bacterium]MBK6372264.1 type 1 periplasmic binding fold superfamily protein [Candidatus Brachybacter algidus]MBK6447489.1 type 1 periplasmic binding fold superfamily protein [Candidatus Brachybacter algidus]MBK7603325.1 type 1 periplasmic binding fold superfamily protein [Candidatus Brachybacter algidus]MBK8356731.1 type 1 periplasmic binding fold superfamily protein [Candidatus Brachybact
MTIKHIYILSLMFVLSSLLLLSCSYDVEPVNEEEVINEIKIILKDEDNKSYILSYSDSDGDGPIAPQITSQELPANQKLTGNITFENTLNTPVQSITDEILEEGDVHQLFYIFSGNPTPSIIYQDSDVNGKPIGLQFEIITKEPYIGKLNLVLRHQPNKNGSNVNTGDITNAGGESDVDISFDVVVK